MIRQKTASLLAQRSLFLDLLRMNTAPSIAIAGMAQRSCGLAK
jgi:hypothetical protein